MKPRFEHVALTEGCSFAALHFQGERFQCPYHVHPEIELLYIKAGSGQRLIGDALAPFRPGDLYLLPPGCPHMFQSPPEPPEALVSKTPATGSPETGDHGLSHQDASPSNASAQSWYLQFLPNCLGEGFFETIEMAPVKQLLTRAERGLVFVDYPQPQIEAQLQAVLKASGTHRLVTFLKLFDVLASWQDARPIASDRPTGVANHIESERLQQVTDFLSQRYPEQISLADTAKCAGLSQSALGRFFRKHLGKTFTDYLVDLRLSEACRLLIETDRSVADICFSVGFQNLSNFNRHFVRRKGVQPRAYRKIQQDENLKSQDLRQFHESF